MITRDLSKEILEYILNKNIEAKDELECKVSNISRDINDIVIELRVREALEKVGAKC